MKRHNILAIACALIAGATSEARSQLATPSARSSAVANSYTARARGYESPFWNPANLGLSDLPSWSVGVAGASTYFNNNSLSYGQITDLYGEFLDDETKSKLLADIRSGDPDRMFEASADVNAAAAALSVWRFAFGVGSVGAGHLDVTPDAVELLLFGNAGEDGVGKDFDLEGSNGEAWALSGAYVSYAQPFTIPALDYLNVRFSVGATVRYAVAHGLIGLYDRGTILTADPLAVDVDAEVISSNDADAGRAWALDFGAAMEYDEDLVVGISLVNAFADINWNEEDFEVRLLTATANFDSTTSNDTTLAFAELDPEDQTRILEYLEAADVPKRLRLGGAYRVSPKFDLSADFVELFGGRLRTRWERTFSLGGEFRPVPPLPLRVGLATDFSHFAYSGGLGIYMGPVHTDFSIGRWGVAGGDGVAAAISISIWPGTPY
ncbi:MAG: hypothetical protein JSU87_07155 [Gemmatimonadota bacterium]|nr:MAG: hypothetical protein JSU87_07155 [Gemmatimonadota bacterium]